MKKRDVIYNKFGGRCAYSGTPLEDDWQIDHMIPIKLSHIYEYEDSKIYYKAKGCSVDDIDNLMPCQKVINHYKHSLTIEMFKTDSSYGLMTLHKRLAKLPKKPRVDKSIKHKLYLLKIADYFGITKEKPFSGKFYFEEKTNERTR